MLHTIIQSNSYQDSIVLMLLTNQISTVEGVDRVSIMMATPANKDIFKTAGLHTPELEAADSNDMAIVLDIETEEVVPTVMAEIDKFLAEQAGSGDDEAREESVKTWDKALEKAKDAPVALISVPGTYAALEIEQAIDAGKHVFCFSDNVALEDEVRLKQKAHDNGLLVMGPDCGTGIINGVPLAFTNIVRPGKIGVVGASGTGIQEVTTIIHKLGEGVKHAIGTGGRDLSEAVGGITLMDAIATLEADEGTEVIVVISKPPHPSVRDRVLDQLRQASKPCVTIFLGEKPASHEKDLYHAYTLEEAANIAVKLARGEEIKFEATQFTKVEANLKEGQDGIKGLYSGGTLANEAGMLFAAALEGELDKAHEGGTMFKQGNHFVVDLGDDKYTQGKPHPMIDPEIRSNMIVEAAQDPTTAVILFDCVLGYGAHANMAEALAPSIEQAKAIAQADGRELTFIATIVGTDQDPQNLKEIQKILEDAGVIIELSNYRAVLSALSVIGAGLEETAKPIEALHAVQEQVDIKPSEQMMAMLDNKAYLNIGLKSFSEAIKQEGGQAVQFDWRPMAGGNITLQKALYFLKHFQG